MIKEWMTEEMINSIKFNLKIKFQFIVTVLLSKMKIKRDAGFGAVTLV